jgi:hypothetical protein
VDLLAPHAILDQTENQRSRHGDDGVRTPQRERLDSLVKTIASSATREPVYGADGRHVMRARNRSSDHIGAVSVGVYNAGLKPRDEGLKRAIFAEIPACPHYYPGDRDAKRLQLIDEGVTFCRARFNDCYDVH